MEQSVKIFDTKVRRKRIFLFTLPENSNKVLAKMKTVPG